MTIAEIEEKIEKFDKKINILERIKKRKIDEENGGLEEFIKSLSWTSECDAKLVVNRPPDNYNNGNVFTTNKDNPTVSIQLRTDNSNLYKLKLLNDYIEIYTWFNEENNWDSKKFLKNIYFIGNFHDLSDSKFVGKIVCGQFDVLADFLSKYKFKSLKYDKQLFDLFNILNKTYGNNEGEKVE